MIRFPLSEILRRLPRVLLGLYLFGAGIALMVEADLGLGPWDVFHQGVSELTGIAIGNVIIITAFFVLLGFIPLHEKVGLGTILNVFLIGMSVNATLAVIPDISAMTARVLLMVAGPIVIAIGSGFYIGGGLGPGPRDGLMTGFARRGIDVWKARLGIEIVVLIVGLLLGGTAGIGTIWFAFGIGPMVQFFLPRLTMSEVPTSSGLPAAT